MENDRAPAHFSGRTPGEHRPTCTAESCRDTRRDSTFDIPRALGGKSMGLLAKGGNCLLDVIENLKQIEQSGHS
jgi:hypothetical protein